MPRFRVPKPFSERQAALQDLDRLKLLSDEADSQRAIAADQIATTNTKASFLLIGAGIIAGSMTLDEDMGGAGDQVAFSALVVALIAGVLAIVSLVPAPRLVLKIDALKKQMRGASTLVTAYEILLATKAASIRTLNAENKWRTRWNIAGYIALSLAFLLAIASWSISVGGGGIPPNSGTPT